MPATIIDGKGIANAVQENLKAQVLALGQPLHLAAVCIGDDACVRAFVRVKQKAAQSVGIQFSSYFFDGTDRAPVTQTLRYLAADESVHGIFIELPLPVGWDAAQFIALIPPDKDVDALTGNAMVPEPAVRALEYVLHEHDVALAGLAAAVVGQGNLVGRPLARWLATQGARVTVIDIETPEPAALARRADLVIAGTGMPGLVTADWVKDGAVVIDYGYGKNKKGAYVGDVDFESVTRKASLITPVPGGMGPLVVAAVLENLVTLATR